MNAKGKGRLKLCLQLAYILGTLVGIYVLGRSDPEMISLFSGKLALQPLWLALCAGGIAGYWLLQACVYAVAGRVAGGPMSFGKNLSMMLLGEYYSALTPFASGGQPMQLGYYKRYGVGLAKGSCILAVRYIGYVGAICLCALAALLWEGRRMLAQFPVVFGLTLMGFAVNLGSIVMVGLILVRPEAARRLGRWGLKQCERLAPRRAAAWQGRFDQGVEEFKAAGCCLGAAKGKCAGIMGAVPFFGHQRVCHCILCLQSPGAEWGAFHSTVWDAGVFIPGGGLCTYTGGRRGDGGRLLHVFCGGFSEAAAGERHAALALVYLLFPSFFRSRCCHRRRALQPGQEKTLRQKRTAGIPGGRTLKQQK